MGRSKSTIIHLDLCFVDDLAYVPQWVLRKSSLWGTGMEKKMFMFLRGFLKQIQVLAVRMGFKAQIVLYPGPI